MRPDHPHNAVALLQRRIRVALGQESGDVVLYGGQVVNVFTREVEPGNVVIADGYVAGVGPYDWDASRRLDVTGMAIAPGLIDGHLHIESTLLTPVELARVMAPHGTSALIADPHEVANVMGVDGIDLLLSASEGLPVDFFFMASSCVPAVEWEHAGSVVDVAAIRQLLSRPRVLGLAEVMDFPAVLSAKEAVLDKIASAQERGVVADGHAPGLLGQSLVGYVAAGIRADHESTTADEARQKARLGMMVQVREGSTEHNLDTLLPEIVHDRLGDWCLCSDDIHPDDLMAHGHLDRMLRRLVAAGVPAARAIRHASWIPARHYGLTDRGAIAPGYRADLVVFRDLESFEAKTVLKDGSVVADDGKPVDAASAKPLPIRNTVRLGPIREDRFRLPLRDPTCPVIGIVPNQIVTRRETMTVARDDGYWRFDPEIDVVMVASIERHRGTGSVGLGLVRGFGFRRDGAIGSSVAHDSHNLIVAGTNPRDMLVCVAALAEHGGGWVAASNGTVQAILPLPFAGLMSTDSAQEVCRQLESLHEVTRGFGCPLAYPLGTLSFLALPVIPELRITDQGLFDVNEQRFISL